ncbi:hypothetical protein J3R82DRAFT_3261 [Butyriboletus roseoflavus]|nr:hypothetical protein J3R82DRAFT_3261 [Butyriboletus roseoflavus]
MHFDDDDDDDDRDHHTIPWRVHVLDNWQIAIQIAQSKLLSNSTNTRLSFLHLTLQQVLDVFKLITETYPRYIDTPSRDAVEQIGMRLVQKDESIRDAPKLGVLDNVLGWLAHQAAHVSKSRSAPSSHPSPSMHSNSPKVLRRSRYICPFELVLWSLHHLSPRFPRLCFIRRMACAHRRSRHPPRSPAQPLHTFETHHTKKRARSHPQGTPICSTTSSPAHVHARHSRKA